MKTYHKKLLASMILVAVLSFFLRMLAEGGSVEKLIAVAMETYL